MLDLWQKADAWGYDSLWNFDHFYPIFVDPEGPCLEGWTTLAALAQATTRARIGHLVNGNTYRNPCVTAKMAATLDHISGGRFNLGIGAGWFELEHHDASASTSRPCRGRLAGARRGAADHQGMFTQEQTTVHGKHYTVTDAIGPAEAGPEAASADHDRRHRREGAAAHRRPARRHVERDRRRRPRCAQLIDVIDRHGETVGRDTTQIEKTVMMPLCYTRRPPSARAWSCSSWPACAQTTPEEAREQIMIGDQAGVPRHRRALSRRSASRTSSSCSSRRTSSTRSRRSPRRSIPAFR